MLSFFTQSIDLHQTKLKTVDINPNDNKSVTIVKLKFYILHTLYSLYQGHFHFLVYEII